MNLFWKTFSSKTRGIIQTLVVFLNFYDCLQMILDFLLESLLLEMFINICMPKFFKNVYLIFNVSDHWNVPNIFMDSDV